MSIKTYAEYAELQELGIKYESSSIHVDHVIIITEDDRMWKYDPDSGIFQLIIDEEPFDDRDPTDDHNLEC